MINTLKIAFQIDITSVIHSFLYLLQHTPFVKEFVSDSVHQNEKLKRCLSFFSSMFLLGRMVLGKFLYFIFIYATLSFFLKDFNGEVFAHTFFFLSGIGMFINYTILSVGKKKYYAIILMKMDAKKYTCASLFYHLLTTWLFNFLCLFIFHVCFFQFDFSILFLLPLFVVFMKIIGEALHLYCYKKFGFVLFHHPLPYFIILILGLILAFLLPYFQIILSFTSYFLIFILLLLPALVALFYILKIEDYDSIYRKINTMNSVMNQGDAVAYSRQMAVDIKKKDYRIDERKLVGKSGYDYFNTIFFLRHRIILSHSAHLYACGFFLFFSGLIIYLLCFPTDHLKLEILHTIKDHFAWIILIMYFINRGVIVTEAMFYNCDRSMLTFPFYRQSSVILNVFKQRLKTLIHINLTPAIVIGVGTVFLLFVLEGKFFLTSIFVLLSILLLSVFFSVHHLVIYYLFQPYNAQMQMKSFSFSIIRFLTYFICYLCRNISLSLPWFSFAIMIFTIIYIIIALILVYKKASHTFCLR